MNRLWLLVLCFLGTLTLAGCPSQSEKKVDGRQTSTTENGEAIAFRINGEVVSKSEFDAMFARSTMRFQKNRRDVVGPLKKRVENSLARKIVDMYVLKRYAKEKNVYPSPEDIEAAFSAQKKRYGSEAAYQNFLKRTEQQDVDVKRDVTERLVRDRVLDAVLAVEKVTEADLRRYFEENKTRYQIKDRLKASHILIKPAPIKATGENDIEKAKTKADKDALEKAKNILKLAKKPGADFTALAHEYSQGPSRSKGGDLGLFSRGRMVKPFEDVAFAAKVGEVVGPVKTKFGYHVIKVFDKKPGEEQTFEAVRETVEKTVLARNRSTTQRTLLERLRADIKIDGIHSDLSLTETSILGTKKAPVASNDAAEQKNVRPKTTGNTTS